MSAIVSYIILFCIIIFAYIILFLVKYLSQEIKQLKHDIRCLEEEHGIFKGSEKGN